MRNTVSGWTPWSQFSVLVSVKTRTPIPPERRNAFRDVLCDEVLDAEERMADALDRREVRDEPSL